MTQAAVIVHGGAGSSVETASDQDVLPLIRAATNAAWSCLQRDDRAELAVVAALRVLEDSEFFDAGYGSFPNENDEIYVDAALMRGNGDYAAFLNVPRVRFPSEIALNALVPGARVQRVWTQRMDAALLAADLDWKHRVGLAASHAELIAPFANAASMRVRKQNSSPRSGDTVGCVVRTRSGALAAGTSTGGTANKPDGRIGDAPIIGSGVYAHDDIVALSATGYGEAILGSLLSSAIVVRIRETKQDLKSIAVSELNNMSKIYADAQAGIILLPAVGAPVFAFNAAAMSVGWKTGSGEYFAVERNEQSAA